MSAASEVPWLDLAECRGAPADLFFPERGDNAGVDAAKAICARCPVITECLDDAIESRELFGIRGGKSGKERREIARQRGTRCPFCGDVFHADVRRMKCEKDECAKAAYQARQDRYNGRPTSSGLSGLAGNVVGPAQRQLPGPVPNSPQCERTVKNV